MSGRGARRVFRNAGSETNPDEERVAFKALEEPVDITTTCQYRAGVTGRSPLY